MEIWIKDLEYELRLLFGASKLQKLTSSKVPGYIENYFKDSIYLHARNLYNFFSNSAEHDANINQFTDEKFDVSFYLKWKSALHIHILHVKNERRLPIRKNIIDGKHLNQQTERFAQDIRRLWQQWIDVTDELKFKRKLEQALKKAEDHAENDCHELSQKLI